MSTIKNISALEILDSRGRPTVEAMIECDSGATARASVPSGASTGALEAIELRDTTDRRFAGMGVSTAVKNVTTKIAPALIGNSYDQATLDRTLIELDGTDNKSTLGANAILAVSLAFARSQAVENNTPLATFLAQGKPLSLPMPMLNLINGGSHANNGLQIQEFMIIPIGAETFSGAIQMATEIFYSLKKLIEEKGFLSSVGDEGGFAPPLQSNHEALDLLLSATERAGYAPGKDIGLALDCASSEYYTTEAGYQPDRDQSAIDYAQHVDYLAQLASQYPIISIEDGHG